MGKNCTRPPFPHVITLYSGSKPRKNCISRKSWFFEEGVEEEEEDDDEQHKQEGRRVVKLS